MRADYGGLLLLSYSIVSAVGSSQLSLSLSVLLEYHMVWQSQQ